MLTLSVPYVSVPVTNPFIFSFFLQTDKLLIKATNKATEKLQLKATVKSTDKAKNKATVKATYKSYRQTSYKNYS